MTSKKKGSIIYPWPEDDIFRSCNIVLHPNGLPGNVAGQQKKSTKPINISFDIYNIIDTFIMEYKYITNEKNNNETDSLKKHEYNNKEKTIKKTVYGIARKTPINPAILSEMCVFIQLTKTYRTLKKNVEIIVNSLSTNNKTLKEETKTFLERKLQKSNSKSSTSPSRDYASLLDKFKGTKRVIWPSLTEETKVPQNNIILNETVDNLRNALFLFAEHTVNISTNAMTEGQPLKQALKNLYEDSTKMETESIITFLNDTITIDYIVSFFKNDIFLQFVSDNKKSEIEAEVNHVFSNFQLSTFKINNNNLAEQNKLTIYILCIFYKIQLFYLFRAAIYSILYYRSLPICDVFAKSRCKVNEKYPEFTKILNIIKSLLLTYHGIFYKLIFDSSSIDMPSNNKYDISGYLKSANIFDLLCKVSYITDKISQIPLGITFDSVKENFSIKEIGDIIRYRSEVPILLNCINATYTLSHDNPETLNWETFVRAFKIDNLPYKLDRDINEDCINNIENPDYITKIINNKSYLTLINLYESKVIDFKVFKYLKSPDESDYLKLLHRYSILTACQEGINPLFLLHDVDYPDVMHSILNSFDKNKGYFTNKYKIINNKVSIFYSNYIESECVEVVKSSDKSNIEDINKISEYWNSTLLKTISKTLESKGYVIYPTNYDGNKLLRPYIVFDFYVCKDELCNIPDQSTISTQPVPTPPSTPSTRPKPKFTKPVPTPASIKPVEKPEPSNLINTLKIITLPKRQDPYITFMNIFPTLHIPLSSGSPINIFTSNDISKYDEFAVYFEKQLSNIVYYVLESSFSWLTNTSSISLINENIVKNTICGGTAWQNIGYNETTHGYLKPAELKVLHEYYELPELLRKNTLLDIFYNYNVNSYPFNIINMDMIKSYNKFYKESVILIKQNLLLFTLYLQLYIYIYIAKNSTCLNGKVNTVELHYIYDYYIYRTIIFLEKNFDTRIDPNSFHINRTTNTKSKHEQKTPKIDHYMIVIIKIMITLIRNIENKIQHHKLFYFNLDLTSLVDLSDLSLLTDLHINEPQCRNKRQIIKTNSDTTRKRDKYLSLIDFNIFSYGIYDNNVLWTIYRMSFITDKDKYINKIIDKYNDKTNYIFYDYEKNDNTMSDKINNIRITDQFNIEYFDALRKIKTISDVNAIKLSLSDGTIKKIQKTYTFNLKQNGEDFTYKFEDSTKQVFSITFTFGREKITHKIERNYPSVNVNFRTSRGIYVPIQYFLTEQIYEKFIYTISIKPEYLFDFKDVWENIHFCVKKGSSIELATLAEQRKFFLEDFYIDYMNARLLRSYMNEQKGTNIHLASSCEKRNVLNINNMFFDTYVYKDLKDIPENDFKDTKITKYIKNVDRQHKIIVEV